jgi:hypothetical protein
VGEGRQTARSGSPYPDPEDVLRAILRMDSKGASLKSRHVRVVDPPLAGAAIRHFGCWGKALTAAGLDAEAVAHRRTWNEDRILQAIRRLDRQGIPLHDASARKADSGLMGAAYKGFGSWNNALRAAGYNPDEIRVRRHTWTREEILDLIRHRAAAGLPVASYTVRPLSAEVASRRLFGSWKAALRAAGIPNPSTEFPIWTKLTIVEGILTRQQAGKPLHCAAVIRETPTLYDAARRLFGSWGEALREAGIDPETVRARRRPYGRAEIVAHIRGHAKVSCRSCDYPGSLVKAARRLFGSWTAALSSATGRPAVGHHQSGVASARGENPTG